MDPRERNPGQEAVEAKGWLAANRWLILRRTSQLGLLLLFLLGPWFDIWIVKGNLASSLTLNTLPLTDPLLLLQELLAGQWPVSTAFIGAAIVLTFYFLVGGRVYCSWVCPVNLVTDSADWLRRRLGLRGGARFERATRYWMLGAVLMLALVTGTLAWEWINPVSMVFRGLIFGMGLAWFMVAAIFVFDLAVSRRGWCSHLCPAGAFYGLLGRGALLRVTADRREACDDCLDCFVVCPEQQVIRPALKGTGKGIGPVILSGECTNCGRCIDVCAQDVFHFTTRFNNHPPLVGHDEKSEVLP